MQLNDAPDDVTSTLLPIVPIVTKDAVFKGINPMPLGCLVAKYANKYESLAV